MLIANLFVGKILEYGELDETAEHIQKNGNFHSKMACILQHFVHFQILTNEFD